MSPEAKESPERFAATLARLDLRSATQAGDYVALRLNPAASCHVYAARRLSDGVPVLLVEVETAAIPYEHKFSHSGGFEVTPEVVVPGREGRVRLVLGPSDRRYEGVFMSLADDVSLSLRGATTDRSAVLSMSGRLAVWQEFFRRNPGAVMSPEARRGLFGELWFLYRHLGALVRPGEAIAAWSGPLKRHHDFQLRNAGIEVKTTTAVAPAKVRISNLRQLDRAGLAVLYLHVVVVDEMQSGGETLPALVERVRAWAAPDGLTELNDALIMAGYAGDVPEQAALPAYHVREERSYEVGEGFPRLIESRVPAGISDVEYAVDLHSCRQYLQDIDVKLRGLVSQS